MAAVDCPHCGTANENAGQFCAQCGKALPSAMPSGPRIVTGSAVASTAVGQAVQAGQLRKQAGQAFGALLAVAILGVIFGFAYFGLLKSAGGEAAKQAPTVLVVNLVLAVIFAGLAFWARVNPLPAAIVGLVVFVTVHVAGAVINLASIVEGLLVKIIIIVVLAKAIQAGVKYRQLRAAAAA